MRKSLRAAFFALLALLLLASQAAALDVPRNDGRFVTDLARLLSPRESNVLGAELRRYAAATGHQIVVLTVPSLEGEDMAGYANRVARAWGVGHKEKNDGVLILVAAAEKRIRFEVGRGVEDRLPDITAGRIQREVAVPAFRAGRYAQGLAASVRSIEAALGSGGGTPRRREPETPGIPWITLGLIVAGVVIMLSLAGRRRRRLSNRGRGGEAEDGLSLSSGFSGRYGRSGYGRYGRTAGSAGEGGRGSSFFLGMLLGILSNIFRGRGGGGGFGGGGFGGGGDGDGGDGGFSGGGGDFGGGGADSGWGGDN